MKRLESTDSPVAALTQRERQVIAMTARGMTNREVGKELEVSVHAVKFHLASIYRKLEVSNRTEAVVTYLRSEAALQDTPLS